MEFCAKKLDKISVIFHVIVQGYFLLSKEDILKNSGLSLFLPDTKCK